MNIRDRVIDQRKVPASSLRPSPFNWRTHPSEQRDALRGVLAEIGFAGAELVRQLEDGSLELIDGHLRAEEMGGHLIPVTVTDLTADEAKKLLAVFDPIGDLAGCDTEKLQDLLDQIDIESPALMQMAEELARKHGLGGDDEPEEPGGEETIPEKYQILVLCRDEHQQASLLERFAAEGLEVRSLMS